MDDRAELLSKRRLIGVAAEAIALAKAAVKEKKAAEAREAVMRRELATTVALLAQYRNNDIDR